MNNIPFDISSVLLIEIKDNSPLLQEGILEKWLSLNIIGKVIFIDPRSIGTMICMSNGQESKDATSNEFQVDRIPKSLFCIFEKLDDAILFKLTWF
jgi:hypothetical protein